ncbi:MAG: hypothetical protein GY743_18365 [Planctomycetaceae bacterium]|nr:hypothetical protein [Planctomycetaceae bacterium]
MQTQKRPHWREDFTVAEHAFKEWRTARKKGARIPHDLWQLALDLAKRHSMAKVAVTLGLDYYSIKRRLTGQTPQTEVVPTSKPAFVEMPRCDSTDPFTCSLEVHGPQESDSKVRLELQGIGAVDLALLVRSIRSHGS